MPAPQYPCRPPSLAGRLPAGALAALCLGFLLALVLAGPAAAKRTVCTVTINSPDEREVMRERLPPADYEIVELVQRGRRDWLDAACRSGVRCDVLVISGHFDGGDQFYSDRLENDESLPVEMLERAACSESCPGVLGGLSEVYLFGCNTLDPVQVERDPVEIQAALVRAGQASADAPRLARALAERHPRSNRDRMRHLFPEVPVIYGFSSKAPLGRNAGPLLERWFDGAVSGEVGVGRPSAELLRLFAPASMTVARGLSSSDPDASYRRDLCRFVDGRTSVTDKLAFVRALVKRDAGELRFYVEALERSATTLANAAAASNDGARAWHDLADDAEARDRFLTQARLAEPASLRARMIDIASALGWLDASARQRELTALFVDRITSTDLGAADVDLACRLAAAEDMGPVRRSLRGELVAADQPVGTSPGSRDVGPASADGVARASLLACLGDASARRVVVSSLASPREQSAELAQVYLRHRPITEPTEYRTLTAAIARMKNAAAQGRALDSLARQPVSDRSALDSLERLYAAAKSVDVQRAVAGVLLRADLREVRAESLASTLRAHRLQLARGSDLGKGSGAGSDVIDVLLRRLEAR